MPRFDLVIFDCDGVLVDSEFVSIGKEVAALHLLGWPIGMDEALETFVGLSQKSANEIIERKLGRPLPENWGKTLQAEIVQAFETELVAIPGIADCLDRLTLPRCVASSSRPERIRRSLEITGLLPKLDPHLFSSTMVPRGKPFPDLFLHAASTLGHQPERCVVIEDSPAGVTAAVAAGMMPIGFVGGRHANNERWMERLRSAGAQSVLQDMHTLPDLLDELQQAR
ncbi:MAG TPA: HAD family hydrolase [Geminicoccus sp.]|uniref:HAD family hydrolase n=1 Tax=Geminicoccus sp. TaxID=2024832 RepID=UPI002E2FF8F3|nr:HAD family hydrolase [Geminicoccus sp.]HEX2528244.1 HAD family hydrolase [Geminicoccus sp.]